MGKTSKWFKNLLTGKKHKDSPVGQQPPPPLATPENPSSPISIPPATPKEKRRWSFRRSSATITTTSGNIMATTSPLPVAAHDHRENYDRNKHVMAVATAMDAAVAAAQAAAAIMHLTTVKMTAAEATAATKIQAVFRSYLARKALCALKGLVKLQALVRGHLVRKQATATLRCMQALLTVQARAREQRVRSNSYDQTPVSAHRRRSMSPSPSPTTSLLSQTNWSRRLDNKRYDHGISSSTHDLMHDNIKIVEMDKASTRSNINRISRQISPAPSELSPRASSGRFDDFSRPPSIYSKQDYAESLCYEFPLCPNYMANTESSRAKARSQSAPKQRPVDFNLVNERQSSSATRRRPSIEGRNVPRGVKMQRSSSHVGQNNQYPWSIKLEKSTVSMIESECGSTSSVLTHGNYCKSLVGFDVHGYRY